MEDYIEQCIDDEIELYKYDGIDINIDKPIIISQINEIMNEFIHIDDKLTLFNSIVYGFDDNNLSFDYKGLISDFYIIDLKTGGDLDELKKIICYFVVCAIFKSCESFFKPNVEDGEDGEDEIYGEDKDEIDGEDGEDEDKDEDEDEDDEFDDYR